MSLYLFLVTFLSKQDCIPRAMNSVVFMSELCWVPSWYVANTNILITSLMLWTGAKRHFSFFFSLFTTSQGYIQVVKYSDLLFDFALIQKCCGLRSDHLECATKSLRMCHKIFGSIENWHSSCFGEFRVIFSKTSFEFMFISLFVSITTEWISPLVNVFQKISRRADRNLSFKSRQPLTTCLTIDKGRPL